MKRFELKNKEHQKVLEELIPNLSDQLENNFYDEWGSQRHRPQRVVIRAFSVSPDDVEEVEVYDPHAWNKYPEVTPPEHAILRCEGHHLYGAKYYNALRYDAQEGFLHLNGNPIDRATSIDRFRLWDEEDKDE